MSNGGRRAKTTEKVSVNKTELKNRITDNIRKEYNYKLTSSLVSLIVDELFALMKDELVNGRTVVIRDFGTLSTFTTKEYLARNPQDTRRYILHKERKSVSFKPSKAFKNRLNDKE